MVFMHKNITTLAEELILDKGDSLLEKALTLRIRCVKDGAIVLLTDVSDPYGIIADRFCGFKADSFSGALALFDKLGYSIVGGCAFLTENQAYDNVELETKIEVSKRKFAGLQHELLGKGTYRGFVTETNFIFDDGELIKNGSMLRLRREEGYRKNYQITYKGGREEGGFNKRQEINLNINTFTGASELFLALGYKPVSGYYKRRELHDFGDTMVFLDRACKIDDKMPSIETWRCFVEVEGDSEEAIKHTLRWKLKIFRWKNITKPYHEIL